MYLKNLLIIAVAVLFVNTAFSQTTAIEWYNKGEIVPDSEDPKVV